MLHNFNIWRKCWLTGLIIISFLKCALQQCGKNEIMNKNECSETTVNGMSCMNCSSPLSNNRQCVKVDLPGDLGSNIKCIYSYNLLLDEIGSKTFSNYPDLTHLYFIRAGFSFSFPKDTFEPLKKLEYFNLTNTNWYSNTEITWPSSLRILDITKFPVNTFHGLTLDHLEVLNVSSTDITEFPTLSEIAPLKLIVLDKVDLSNFKIEDMARLCKLESISTLGMSLGKDNCKCLLLKAWTEKYGVKIINEMKCKADTRCLLNFTETSLKNRNECLAKNEQAKIWYYVVFGLIGLLFSILCGSAFLYTWLVKKEEEEGILGITDEELENLGPHHKTVESNLDDDDAATEGEVDAEESEAE